jgi:phospholipase/carboxylesterase
MAADVPTDPHRDQPVLTAGADLANAPGAVIMIHGRGADANDILSLAQVFRRADLAFLAPEAAGRAWYPNRFMTPVEDNEPYLSSALGVISALLDTVAADGLSAERVVLLGFSQGACLVLEYAARNPRRYAGVLAFSGGLIGETVDHSRYDGSLAGTPVFLGCSDVDPHIPLVRVNESSALMRDLGGEVTERIYPGLGHTISMEEIAEASRMLATIPSR